MDCVELKSVVTKPCLIKVSLGVCYIAGREGGGLIHVSARFRSLGDTGYRLEDGQDRGPGLYRKVRVGGYEAGL